MRRAERVAGAVLAGLAAVSPACAAPRLVIAIARPAGRGDRLARRAGGGVDRVGRSRSPAQAAGGIARADDRGSGARPPAARPARPCRGRRSDELADRPPDRLRPTGNAILRHGGHSRLTVGPTLGLLQGNYLDTCASARIGSERSGLSPSLSNLLDTPGNRFAPGKPFDVTAARQMVPLRPRTIRIGFDAHV